MTAPGFAKGWPTVAKSEFGIDVSLDDIQVYAQPEKFVGRKNRSLA